ncbi:neutrophil collagenase-like [Camponotus floridanus]|uniref:neutrophil collagenase-like n=1 Tax=Camponotus floridanus TaxID=104421 RepID=UPI000DC67CBE|nr:neutrophil collagenase-like [Camponotus floridanus]
MSLAIALLSASDIASVLSASSVPSVSSIHSRSYSFARTTMSNNYEISRLRKMLQECTLTPWMCVWKIQYIRNLMNAILNIANEENHQQSSLLDNVTALSEALSLFQEYYSLPGNGVLTVETIRVMRRPRCGVADVHAYSPLTRKWPRTHLTWNFKLANRDTLRTTQSAFALCDNGGSCPSPFAGPESVVAHAFFPTGESNQVTEVHVDETEPWHITLTRPSSDRLYLLQTLTHEIGHTLGLTHRKAISAQAEHRGRHKRNLYGSRETTNPTIVDATPTTAATTTTTTASTTTTTAAAPPRTVKPPLAPSDTADLCALKRVDGALIMNRRLYVARKRNVWPVDMRERRYGAPFSFADYFKFLPRNLTHVSAMYQRPSGDIAIFAGDYVYLADSNFHLKAGWPRSVQYVGFPRDARINAAINTHAGRSYVIYNDDKIAEINDCAMTVARHGALRDTFSGMPSAITAAFRHVDGNLYFLKKREYYAYSEFIDAIISAGPFDLSILGIECPADGILHRLSELVSKLYRLEYASFERSRNDDDNDDD